MPGSFSCIPRVPGGGCRARLAALGFNYLYTRANTPSIPVRSIAAAGGDVVCTRPSEHIDYVFRMIYPCSSADLGKQGGVPGFDGTLDNNDFVVFIDAFFAGC